jgi:simple sugar transport system ATP-binding protein
MTTLLQPTTQAAERGAQCPVLRVIDATKTYKGVHAIEKVNFELMPGEVHAMVGENGAGKSTLCKAIAGAVHLDGGEIHIDGERVLLATPADALRHGIAMVYQETSLVPTMTVAQNINLGHEKLLTRFRTLNIAAQQLLQSMSFNVDPTAYVSTLGGAKKQMVEITRALRADARVIIFDEPTASLTPEEVMHLFQVINDLKRAGVGIIFVSHALEEALQISDRVTVLRDGHLQTTELSRNLTRADLVRHMVGRNVEYTRLSSDAAEAPSTKRKALSVQNLTMGTVVKNMTFSAYAGEVLGIFGLIGAGRTETAKIVAGAMKRNRIHGGSILLNGKPVRYRVPRQAMNDGIAYLTEDRKLAGFFETMGIEDNVYLGALATKAKRRWLYSSRDRRRVAQPLMERLRVRTINRNALVIELSGGNQQKVVIAKSLVQDPSVIIFDEPTRGVDVGAIAEIHQIIRTLADEGKAVIVISSYLPEVLAISDRILVARQGRMVAEFNAAEATAEKIMYAAIF